VIIRGSVLLNLRYSRHIVSIAIFFSISVTFNGTRSANSSADNDDEDASSYFMNAIIITTYGLPSFNAYDEPVRVQPRLQRYPLPIDASPLSITTLII
jgi:hypothetical protein